MIAKIAAAMQRKAGMLVPRLFISAAPAPNNAIAATIFMTILKIYDFIAIPPPFIDESNYSMYEERKQGLG
mgnify:CR=1 FL=1